MAAPTALVYVRVSTGKQEEDGTSLATQEERCRQYAADHGYAVAGIYSDVHTGAEYRERGGLSKLREQVREGQADVVILYALDRLSRNQAHVYILCEEFEQHGARLELVTEDFEDSAVGRFIRSAKAFAAEVEREKIVERTTRGVLARARSGRLLVGARPLYGYAWADEKKTRLTLDPVTSPIVRRIFQEAVSGKPLRRIAADLTADGIPTPTGKMVPWTHTAVAVILKHPNYTGNAYTWAWRAKGNHTTKVFDHENAIPVPAGTVPALVDQATWDAVQAQLKRNKARASRNNRKPEETLLRGGYAICGHCGRTMTVRRTSRGEVRYVCYGDRETAEPCRAPSIYTSVLDRAVWSKVERVLTKPEIVATEVEKLRADDPTEADLAAVDRAIATLERKRQNLSRAIANTDDADTSELLLGELSALNTRKRDLDTERQRILSQYEGWVEAQNQLDSLTNWCSVVAANLNHLSYDDRRVALQALGIQVQVFGAGHEPRYIITAAIPLNSAIVYTPSIVSFPAGPTAPTASSSPTR